LTRSEAGSTILLVGLSRQLSVISLICVLVLSVALPALASVDDSNYHTHNGIDHGWIRTYVAQTDQFTFNVWTEHNHGAKAVDLWHDDYSHWHCSSAGNVNHVDCSDAVNDWHHLSYHAAPDNDINPNDCTYNTDGHGICPHAMNSKAP
jgi:hypothetical protein